MVKGALLCAALALTPFAAMAAPAAVEAPYTIERSLVTSVTAPDGHTYHLFVAWPDGPPPATGWPVLYVLDGADNFAVVTETARRLARASARSGIGDGIVVGIDSGPLPRRVLDYTPSVPNYQIPTGMPAAGLATGGADAFLDVLARSIMPQVAQRWRVDRARQTLVGHSFGGLIALHAAFTRPGLFVSYAAISPSLWYGNGLLAREAAAGTPVTARILMAAGDGEMQGGDLAAAAGQRLADDLAHRGTKARFVTLAGQGHGTSMLAAIGDVVAFAFGTESMQ